MCSLSSCGLADGSAGDQQLGGRPASHMEQYYNNRNKELQVYRRGYFDLVVAAILAKARRDADCTDDLTAAAAKWKISDEPPQPQNSGHQHFKF